MNTPQQKQPSANERGILDTLETLSERWTFTEELAQNSIPEQLHCCDFDCMFKKYTSQHSKPNYSEQPIKHCTNTHNSTQLEREVHVISPMHCLQHHNGSGMLGCSSILWQQDLYANHSISLFGLSSIPVCYVSWFRCRATQCDSNFCTTTCPNGPDLQSKLQTSKVSAQHTYAVVVSNCAKLIVRIA